MIAFFLYYLEIMQVKKIHNKLKKLNDENRNELCNVSLPSKINNDLVLEINRFIMNKINLEKDYRITKNNYKKQISNISHDMRTPLTSIIGYIELLNKLNLTEKEKQDYLNIIGARANNLQDLISDFYTLSRLDEKEYPFHLEKIKINELCLSRIALKYDDLEKSKIEIDTNIKYNDISILSDENALTRVFDNILENARKYALTKLQITNKVKGNYLVITFKNDSDFIPEDKIAHLFDRSFVVDESRTNKGTGLGLAICKSFMENLNHEINVNYKNDNFIIELKFKLERRS